MASPPSKGEPELEAKDFFVSYTGSDRAWAEWISYVLEAAGYSVILQSWDFLHGGNFVLDMDRAVRASKRTIAVLSRAYCESGFTRAEWADAFSADPDGRGGLLIPVRVEDFKPPGLLRSIAFLDLVGLGEQESKKALLEAVEVRVEGGRRKPDTSPPFPGGEQQAEPHFPGALPSVWNLPLRLRNFTGRDDFLTLIHGTLAKDRTCVLFGLGGVGKSRSAVEYAYRHLDDYDLVWRLRAHDDATARADLADLANALQLPDPDKPRAERIEALRSVLAARDRWLLIFDDATAAGSLLPLLPPGSSGNVLVTSRTGTGWQALGEAVELGPFRETEALCFLRARLGRDDEEDLRRICETLGNLPLAVEQAAGYMEATGIDPGAYVERLVKRSPELLRRPRPIDYEHTVSTTWQLSMEQINTHREAGSLLTLCAYLGADLIPRGLFDDSDGSFSVTPVFSPAEVDAGLEELRRYSLVALSTGRISLHPLVQWVAREAQSEEERVETIDLLAGLLMEAWPKDCGIEPSSWSACGLLAPHLHSFARTLGTLDRNCDLAGDLLSRIGIYLRCLGDLEAAVDVYEEALAVLGDVSGVLLIRTLCEYGVTLTFLNRDEEAVQAQERALAELQRCDLFVGEEGNVYQLAGVTFCQARQFERARGMFETSIQLFQQEPEPDLHKIGSGIGNLGNVFRLLGDFDEARRLQTEALGIMEEVHGPSHPDVGIGLGALARLYFETGDLDAARANLERAKDMLEAAYGPVHFEVGRAYHDLALLDARQGRWEGARTNYARALESYRRTNGSDPELSAVLRAYADVCERLGDHTAAEAAMTEAESNDSASG